MKLKHLSWSGTALFLFSLFLFGCGTTSHHQMLQPLQGDMKKYQVMEIAKIENYVPQTFSQEWCVRLKETLIAYAQKTERFKEVLGVSNWEKDASATDVLIIKPTVTGYEAGSGVKRYFVGFGAGKAVLHVKLELYDKSSGEVRGACILTSEAMHVGTNVFRPMGQQFAALILRYL